MSSKNESVNGLPASEPGVFVDANILFSAAYREESPAGLLFALAARNDCRLYATNFVVDEAVRNIALKRPERLVETERLAKHLAIEAEPDPKAVRAASEHVVDKDAPVLAGAIESSAQLLVTGDRRHFGHLFGVEIDGILVLPLAETLERILSPAT